MSKPAKMQFRLGEGPGSIVTGRRIQARAPDGPIELFVWRGKGCWISAHWPTGFNVSYGTRVTGRTQADCKQSALDYWNSLGAAYFRKKERECIDLGPSRWRMVPVE